MRNPFAVAPDRWVSPSLNQVRIVDLPGITLPPVVKGKKAYELLSASALRKLVCQAVPELRLDLCAPGLLESFDDCLASDSPMARETAEAFGRRLGYLLLTLKRGDVINRQARPDWREEHWAFWNDIDTVWLGGGLASGKCGPVVTAQAEGILYNAGYSTYRVRLSPFPKELALIGAARHISPGARTALVFDFGYTWVKRAIVHYVNQTLTTVRTIAELPSPCRIVPSVDYSRHALETQMGIMIGLISDSWSEVKSEGLHPDPETVISLACHMYRGHPFPGVLGCYGRLQLFTDDLQKNLANRLSERIGQSVQVKLIQDATAAAAVFAGESRTAVVMLGTSLGIGFPPENDQLRALPEDLHHLSCPVVGENEPDE